MQPSHALTCSHGLKGCNQKRIGIDLYYAPMFYSNRAIYGFGHDMLDGIGTVYDWLGDKTYLSSNPVFRALYGVAALYFPGFMRYPSSPLELTIHEYGHGSRSGAIGGIPSFGFFSSSGTHAHFLTYYLMAHVSGWSGGYATTTGRSFMPSISPSYWSAVTTAGGVNNSAGFAEYLGDRAYHTGGHFVHALTYINSKLDAHNYALGTYRGSTGLPAGTVGDMTNIVNYYSAQGMGISLQDIWTGSLNSLIFSSSTYAYAWGAGKYVFSADPSVRALEIGPLRLPDLSHYLTSQGLSYRVGSGLRFGDTVFPFSAELVYKGRSTVEVSLAMRKYVHWNKDDPKGFYEIGLVGNTLGGIGGHFMKEIELGSSTLLGFGAILHHYQTLRGERQTTAIHLGPMGIEAWLNLTKTY